MVIGLCALAVVASGVVLMWIVRRGIRPVEQIASAIDTLRENDLSTRLNPPDVPTELQPVVDKLNGLLQRLDGAFAREKAFTADVAHEFRTPISALLTTFEVCRSRPRDEPAYIAAIDKCRDVARGMQAMVETLLILTRADAGQLSLALRDTDIASLLEDCWALFEIPAERRKLTVQWQVPDELRADTDPEKLRIILHNLFDNAISYCNDAGTIRIQAELQSQRLLIEVANTGSQIPADRTRQLFERFWRGDRARAAIGVHCGLGLSLCQRLSALLSGKIDIQSADGQWFVVRLELPVASKPQVIEPAAHRPLKAGSTPQLAASPSSIPTMSDAS
jgi:heavy metal sensor kinase